MNNLNYLTPKAGGMRACKEFELINCKVTNFV